MKKYFAPLGIFVIGNLIMLAAFMFFSAFGTAGDAVATAATDTYGGLFWGLSWAAGSMRFLVYIFAELIILFSAGYAFIKTRD